METAFKLARALDVSIEDLLAESVDKRPDFELFKSAICHRVKDSGDLDFIIDTYKSGEICELYNKQWYPEVLYLLAMVDYISRENGLSVNSDYHDLRRTRLSDTLYPVGIILRCAVEGSDNAMSESVQAAIPEFMRFNIVESDVRNVC